MTTTDIAATDAGNEKKNRFCEWALDLGHDS